MYDYQKISEASRKAKEALDLRIDSQVEKTFNTLIKVFNEEIPDGVKLSAEAMVVQLEVMALMIDYHIQKGDLVDIGGHTLQLITLFEGVKDSGEYQEKELEQMEDIVFNAVKKSRAYMVKVAEPSMPAVKYERKGKCLLCRENDADAVGSHLVPHMLIQQLFSYDGKKGRDKEIAEMFNLSGGEYSNYFGRNINSDIMSDINNRPVSDAEIDCETLKHSVFTRDHFFCQYCEKRFMAIESYYADIMNGKIKNYPPAIPYLFWVSVIWRMSIGNMGLKMYPKDEKILRKILDKTLSKERDNILVDRSNFGKCAYNIYHCDDIKDETTGIIGMHRRTIPYKVLIGKDYINFFMSHLDARKFNERHNDPVDDYNDGTKKETKKNIPLISFWLAKRSLLDENYVYDQYLIRKGIRPADTITRFVDQDKDLFADFEGKYVANVGMSVDIIKDDRLPVYPRAVSKILNYIEKHQEEPLKEGMTEEERVAAEREAITKSTGYSIEEIGVIMDYWKRTSGGLKKNRRKWSFENV